MKTKKGKIITIIVSAVVVAALGIMAFFYFKKDTIIKKTTKEVTEEATPKKDGEDLLASYVNETKYIGGIGYPIVYNLPFGHSEYYKTNKQLWEEGEVDIEGCVDTATQFVNLLFNASYKNILENRDMYTANIADLMDRDFFYEEDEYGNGYDYHSYIENLENYVIDNEIEMESTFLTDTSLVFSDGYYLLFDLIHVRGVVECEVFASKDENFPVTDGKKPMMIDITLHRNTKVPGKYDVIAFNLTSLEPTEAD